MKKELGYIMIAVIIALLSINGCQHYNLGITKGLLKASGDTLQTYKNKNGELVAKTSTFQAQNAQLFLDLESKDSTTKKLQSLVKDYKKELSRRGSATIITTETVYDTSKFIDTTHVADLDSGTVLADTTNNKWLSLIFGFKFKENFTDESYFSLRVHNEYELVIGEDKNGFLGLGKRTPFVELTNKNPYTDTKELKVFEVVDGRKKRWVLGPQFGITLGQGLSLQPTLGAGITYNLISF